MVSCECIGSESSIMGGLAGLCAFGPQVGNPASVLACPCPRPEVLQAAGEPYKLEILDSIVQRDPEAPITIYHIGASCLAVVPRQGFYLRFAAAAQNVQALTMPPCSAC